MKKMRLHNPVELKWKLRIRDKYSLKRCMEFLKYNFPYKVQRFSIALIVPITKKDEQEIIKLLLKVGYRVSNQIMLYGFKNLDVKSLRLLLHTFSHCESFVMPK
mmetsp:Transcript_4905/g.4158  ORF Transcript_4905/g.4158 Transcript_4905/m.4158 type:complete len:104 (+) Transcript_4905:209-520(+)